MDATSLALQREIESAKRAIVAELDPLVERLCPDCGSTYRRGKRWYTSWDIRTIARDRQSAGSMGLAMHDLIDEGIVEVNKKSLKVRLKRKGQYGRRARTG
ncbi:MAG TPA: hypothetical protein VLF21_00120 [Candidatus Saccharimonadales bacterium]|nr:hypothetical protein [Candidatus Saccharimonadales bacterium]